MVAVLACVAATGSFVVGNLMALGREFVVVVGNVVEPRGEIGEIHCARSFQPQRHRGGSPFHQQIAIITTVSPHTLTRKPVMFRTGGKSNGVSAKRATYTSVTSVPSHVHGGPQPQP